MLLLDKEKVMKKFSFYTIIALLLFMGGLIFFSSKTKEPVASLEPSSIHRLHSHVANVRERLQPERQEYEIEVFDKLSSSLKTAYEKRKLPEGDIHIILEALFLARQSPQYHNLLTDVEKQVTSSKELDRDELVSHILSQSKVSMDEIKQSFGMEIMNQVEEIVQNNSTSTEESIQ